MIRLANRRSNSIPSGLPPGPVSAGQYFGVVLILSLPFYTLGFTGATLPFAPALPISALMACVPMFAALCLVWHRNGGTAAGKLFNSAFDIRAIPGAGWVAVAVGFMPVAFGLTGGLVWLSGPLLPVPDLLPASAAIPALVLFFIGAVGEEVGWQGYAYPVLRQTRSALGAALIVGVVWASWHVIPFWLMGRTVTWIIWQSLAIGLMRIVIVWLVLNAGQSILIAVLFHMMSNSAWGVVLDFDHWYDPMIMSVILGVSVAAIVVLRGLDPSLLAKDGLT